MDIYIYMVSTVTTDALVLKHQAISSHSAEYAPMCIVFPAVHALWHNYIIYIILLYVLYIVYIVFL